MSNIALNDIIVNHIIDNLSSLFLMAVLNVLKLFLVLFELSYLILYLEAS